MAVQSMPVLILISQSWFCVVQKVILLENNNCFLTNADFLIVLYSFRMVFTQMMIHVRTSLVITA